VPLNLVTCSYFLIQLKRTEYWTMGTIVELDKTLHLCSKNYLYRIACGEGAQVDRLCLYSSVFSWNEDITGLSKHIVAYRPVAKRRLCKHQPLLYSTRSIRVRGDVTQQYKRWCRRCSLWVHSETVWLDQPSSVERGSAVQLGVQVWNIKNLHC
jgi:hypothetical protein